MNNINNNSFIKEINGVGSVIEIENNIKGVKGEILFLIEKMDKAWKNYGQISIPFGTSEEGENPINTAVREIEEEAGLNVDKSLLKEKGKIIMYIDTKQGRIKVNICIYHILLNSKPKIEVKNPEEIENVFFSKVDNLKNIHINDIRPGTLEAILGYDKNISSGIVYTKDGIYNKNYYRSIK